MAYIGAFLGGPDAQIPAGFCGVSLCVNTTDRNNISTARWTITAEGFSTEVDADSSGRAYVEIPAGPKYTIELNHDGFYENDGPQTIETESKMRYGVYFDLFTYPDISTVVRVLTSSAGMNVTGTSGTNSMTAVSDSNGVAEFQGMPTGSIWTFSDGSKTETVTIDRLIIIVNFRYTPLVINEVKFSMSFNSSTFATDPEGCLTYADGCAGFTPVSSPPSVLGACSELGSWDMNEDGSSTNPFLDSCFYATFDEDGNLHERLNPKNLAEIIGLWDSNNKGWVPASGPSSIESENTMFCFPALYRMGTGSKVTIGTNSKAGVAYGAKIGDHTYQYVAIGVYLGYVQDRKLMSLSGKVPSTNISRPNFRSLAAENKVRNGVAMIWNFFQYRDWWHLYLFGAKSFNGQASVGQGGFRVNGKVGQGLCNAMGLWAGSSDASVSTSTSVKALIENPWGYMNTYIDDFVYKNGTIYADQNYLPDDYASYQDSQLSIGTSSGWQGGINKSSTFWGVGIDTKGTNTTHLCDYRTSGTSNTTLYAGIVGGDSEKVGDGSAGPSYLYASASLDVPESYGARLAFVFDL